MRYLPSLLLSLLLPASLAAQPAANPTANVEFRTIGINSDISGVGFKTGDRYTPVQAKNNVVSGSYRYSGPATMTLYRGAGPAAGRGGEASAQLPVAGTITFQPPTGQAAASGRYLVVLLDGGGGQFVGAAMPDNTSGFPPSSVRIFNGSTLPMTVNINDKPVPLRGGEFKIVPLGSATRLEVRAFMSFQGELTEITNNVFSNNDTTRRTIFFVVTNPAQLRSDPNVPPQIQMTNYIDRPNAEASRRGGRGGENLGPN